MPARISTPLRSTYSPDTLTNNELGFKTEFFGHRLQFNGAVYQEDWKNTIVEFFDPQQGFGNLTFSTNGPNYRVRGLRTAGHRPLDGGIDGDELGDLQQEHRSRIRRT